MNTPLMMMRSYGRLAMKLCDRLLYYPHAAMTCEPGPRSLRQPGRLQRVYLSELRGHGREPAQTGTDIKRGQAARMSVEVSPDGGNEPAGLQVMIELSQLPVVVRVGCIRGRQVIRDRGPVAASNGVNGFS